MKSINKLLAGVICLFMLLITALNLMISYIEDGDISKQYLVDINRISRDIEAKGLENIDLSPYTEVRSVKLIEDVSVFNSNQNYAIRQIGGKYYCFYYVVTTQKISDLRLITNAVVLASALFSIGIIIYIRRRIIVPFDRLKNVPYELSKGNLTTPMQENKTRFFGKFIWGMDLLREKLETQKRSELELQKEKKMLMLSLSHDIKTPLSAIKLYSKALSKGLYTDKEKQHEISENINLKADEIEQYISQIINASREDFLSLDVNMSEFYLSALIKSIGEYYTEKMSLMKINFNIDNFFDCIIKGDLDRSIEVLQNVLENAIKYGDGNTITVGFGEEEGCILISVKNSGCTLSETELPHIFESFNRGTNAENIAGSGLGLYICRCLMNKMGGEIFAEISGGYMTVTAVFVKS